MPERNVYIGVKQLNSMKSNSNGPSKMIRNLLLVFIAQCSALGRQTNQVRSENTGGLPSVTF